MNNFQKSELIGRQKFQSILDLLNILLYRFTEDEFDLVDCYYTSHKGKKVAVEIKVRSLLWNTLFMEGSKYLYMYLLMLLKKVDYSLYVNFIGDLCYIFELHTIKKKYGCKTSYVWANRTTAQESGKKLKLMIEIPIELAIELELKNGIWTKNYTT